jgi:hypothetical protein
MNVRASSASYVSGLGKYLAAWFVMLLVAVANGTARDLVYGPYMSELAAHQLSTAIGIVLFGAVIRQFIYRFPPSSDGHAIFIGLLWMALTVAFEFLFFHYVGGRSWRELLSSYDIFAGRVWVLVLLWIAAAPYAFHRLRRKATA